MSSLSLFSSIVTGIVINFSFYTGLIECGKECLNRLTSMVIGDLATVTNELFTQEWLSSDGTHMKVVVATTSDYIQDFKTLLSSFWFEKLKLGMGKDLEHTFHTYIHTYTFIYHHHHHHHQHQQ